MRSYRGAARFSTWLYRIAYYTFLNDQRGRHMNIEFKEDEHASAEDSAAATATTLDVDRALGRLSVRQRAVFDLHYKKGMTHSEVADALELPLADYDFSASVLARLPPRRRRSAVRRWTLTGAACLGSILTATLAPPLGDALASLSPWMVPQLALTTVAVVAIVLVPSLYFLFAERADR